jgi:hypothetical protein
MIKVRLLILTVFIIQSLGAFAQDKDLLFHGTIRDIESKAPIPFASISITNTTRGSAADESGNFKLLVKAEDLKYELKVSSIGYLTKSYKISSLDPVTLNLELQSDVKLLSEITIAENAINPIEVVKGAIDSLFVNYRIEPFNMNFYSTLTASNAVTGEQFKVESIVFGYCKGYGTNSEKNFEILKRRTEGNNFLKALDYPFWPTLEIHRADVISDPFKTGILNVDNLDKFTFSYSGVSVYELDTVYQIDYYAPKPTKKITGYGVVPEVYKGTIFITVASHAIVRHDIETDQFQHSIIYKKIGDKYFPYLINGKRKLKGANAFININNSIILTSIALDEVQVIERNTNEFRNIMEVPEDVEYWQTNYPKTGQ